MRNVFQVVGPARIVRQDFALGLHQPLEFLDAELAHQELQPRRIAILLLAEPGEHAGDRLREGQDLFFRNEFVVQPGLLRHGAESSADPQLESAPRLAVFLASDRDGAEIVQPHQRAGILFAAGKRDLEFPPERLCVRMPQHEIRDRLRVGRDIERLFAADAGDRAGGHVAHRIAASFAGRDADRRETPHQRRRVFNVDEMKLHVLAGGDVRDAVRVFLAKIGQHLQLRGVQAAERNLDALHAGRVPQGVGSLGVGGGIVQRAGGLAVGPLTVVIALPVGAAPQPGFGEDAVLDFALFLERDLVFEHVELGGEMLRNTIAQLRFPLEIAGFHLNTLKYIGIG